LNTIRSKYLLIFLSILTLIFFIMDLLIGSVSIRYEVLLDKIFKGNDGTIESIILFDFRIPKALAAILVGAGLSVSGVLMQSLFRNPLAGPYVLGVSSGASLMVAIVIMSSGTGLFLFNSSPWLIAIAAIIGSFGVLFLVLAVSIRVPDSVSLLIIGIMIAGLASSVVSLLQYFTTADMLQHFMVWTFGSLSSISYDHLIILLPVVSIGLFLSFLMQKQLNSMLLGDNYAQLLGVSLKKMRYSIIILTGLIAGSITAFAGPIVFIGVAVPHIARSIFRTNDHHWLIPASIVIGSSLMLICDIISQLPGTSNALPINSVTSFVGAPVIIWIILKNRRLRTVNF
jgi:iron complex transport system permease protein